MSKHSTIQYCGSSDCVRRGILRSIKRLSEHGYSCTQTGCQSRCEEGATLIVDDEYLVTNVTPTNVLDKVQHASRDGESLPPKRTIEDLNTILDDF